MLHILKILFAKTVGNRYAPPNLLPSLPTPSKKERPRRLHLRGMDSPIFHPRNQTERFTGGGSLSTARRAHGADQCRGAASRAPFECPFFQGQKLLEVAFAWP